MAQNEFKPRLARLLAEFFYCGRFPFAPGTVGSLGSLVIWIPSLYFAWPWWLKSILLVGIFFVGVWASEYGIRHYQRSDPKQVVIDEVVGQGIPFLILAPTIMDVVLAFALFRFFDILKPWPIKAVEERFDDKWGIMLDDVVAGIFALMVMFVAKAGFMYFQ